MYKQPINLSLIFKRAGGVYFLRFKNLIFGEKHPTSHKKKKPIFVFTFLHAELCSLLSFMFRSNQSAFYLHVASSQSGYTRLVFLEETWLHQLHSPHPSLCIGKQTQNRYHERCFICYISSGASLYHGSLKRSKTSSALTNKHLYKVLAEEVFYRIQGHSKQSCFCL